MEWVVLIFLGGVGLVFHYSFFCLSKKTNQKKDTFFEGILAALNRSKNVAVNFIYLNPDIFIHYSGEERDLRMLSL